MSHSNLFTNEHLGKLFYFCLKKTGNEQDAEELSGDISLQIVQALSRGKVPENFDAWIWTVARNCWARWATKKYYKNPEQVNIQDYEEILSSAENLEKDVIHFEELALLRRELAFIRADYRRILVAHYFEEMSVSEISQKYDIPLGTVKTRLQSSRKILKEGMNMARKFGTRSYNPETIGFIASGSQPTGLPWKAVKRKIPVNILCAANNNPSTLEELSMELGIAMPYMEEEVELLVKSELLRKLDKDRYITNFFISPRECQSEINELSCQFAEKNYHKIWDMAENTATKAKELGIATKTVSDMDTKAFFAFYLQQQIECSVQPQNLFSRFHRRDGGTWGFIGREKGATCRLPRAFFNNNCCMRDGVNATWKGYQCNDPDYGNRPYQEDVPDVNTLMLLEVIATGCDISGLSPSDRHNLEYLLTKGFCVKTPDGKVNVAALVFSDNTLKELKTYFTQLPEYRQLCEESQTYINDVREIISRYSLPYFEEDFDYYVGMSIDLHDIFARLWKDKGLYTGGNAQFAALYY